MTYIRTKPATKEYRDNYDRIFKKKSKKEHCPRRLMGEKQPPHQPCDTGDFEKDGQLGVKCLECGEVIRSTYRHDFKWCRCESVFVDGGKDYFRYGSKDGAKFEIVKT